MMKLKEWEKSLSYAKKLCKETDIDIRYKTYTMYDGRKGIYLQLFDSAGLLYKEVASGIYERFEDMKKALDLSLKRLEEA